MKNPQLIFDVQVSDNEDAILAVIAQTFIDSCMVSEHKVGRVRAETGHQRQIEVQSLGSERDTIVEVGDGGVGGSPTSLFIPLTSPTWSRTLQ